MALNRRLPGKPAILRRLVAVFEQMRDTGKAAAFLSSPLASGITGSTVYVDKGYHAMGMAVTDVSGQ